MVPEEDRNQLLNEAHSIIRDLLDNWGRYPSEIKELNTRIDRWNLNYFRLKEKEESLPGAQHHAGKQPMSQSPAQVLAFHRETVRVLKGLLRVAGVEEINTLSEEHHWRRFVQRSQRRGQALLARARQNIAELEAEEREACFPRRGQGKLD